MLAPLSISRPAVRLHGVADTIHHTPEPNMQYLLLIYANEQNWAKLDDAQGAAMHSEYQTFTESIAKSGHFKGGNALQPTQSATTVRVRDALHPAA
ncbi:MAG: hypothetical protein ABI205_08775 [Gemmatimonadaceae bacterium]